LRNFKPAAGAPPGGFGPREPGSGTNPIGPPPGQ
jgi:hypothetical protein